MVLAGTQAEAPEVQQVEEGSLVVEERQSLGAGSLGDLRNLLAKVADVLAVLLPELVTAG